MKSSRAGSMAGPVPHGGAQSNRTTVPPLSPLTLTPVAVVGVKVAPALLTATVYVPGATLGNWNAPLASLIAVRADGPVSVTCTPATPDPREVNATVSDMVIRPAMTPIAGGPASPIASLAASAGAGGASAAAS